MSTQQKHLPISHILKQIIHISYDSKTVDPQPKTSFFSRYLNIICHHLCKGNIFTVHRQPTPAREINILQSYAVMHKTKPLKWQLRVCLVPLSEYCV